MENTATYPMTISQKGIASIADFLHSLDAIALTLCIDFNSEIDEKIMLDAIQETGRRLPYLRVRLYREKDGTVRQYLSDEEPLPTEITDFAPKNEKDQEKQFRAWKRKDFSDSYENIQLYRFRLLRYPDGHHGLYFCLEHLIMDGYAGMYTLQYLSQVYKAMRKGTELPAQGPEPWKLVEDDIRFSGSSKYQAGVEKLLKAYEPEPQFTSINGLGSPEFIKGKRYGKRQNLTQFGGEVMHYSLDKALTDRIIAEAKNRSLSPQTFYLLALRSYLGHVCQTDDVTVRSLMNCRSTLYEKHCGLNVTNTHYLRTILSDDCTFSDGLLNMNNSLLNIMRYARISYITVNQKLDELYQMDSKRTFYAPTWFSYFPPLEKEEDDLDLSVKFISTGFAGTPLYMIVMPDSNSGTVSVLYWYAVGYTRPKSIENFHGFMLKFLEKGLDAPETPLGTLIQSSL